ncbi:MAG: hydrogenase maturation protease [Desulfovibrionales bacterium]
MSPYEHSHQGPPITIVGAGNWLVSCDRIGPRVLQLCQRRYGSGVELFDSGSAGLALLDCIRGQDLLMVVDACKHGGPSGEITIREMDFISDLTHGPSVHQIGPLETLVVARHLYPERLPRRVLLVMVETEGMMESDLDSVCRRVIALLDREIFDWRKQHEQEIQSV